jgi:hypothetical protein
MYVTGRCKFSHNFSCQLSVLTYLFFNNLIKVTYSFHLLIFRRIIYIERTHTKFPMSISNNRVIATHGLTRPDRLRCKNCGQFTCLKSAF